MTTTLRDNLTDYTISEDLVTSHNDSPLFIKSGSGIVSLKEPVLMSDGEMYMGVFCDSWKVQNNSNNKENYCLVGYVGNYPAVSIPGNNIRSFAISPTIHQGLTKRLFNVGDFWGSNGNQNPGFNRYGGGTSRAS